jgi:hypothetical protein
VTYEYHPKYPRQKLREVVQKYLQQLAILRRETNCDVSFVQDGRPGTPTARGWLLEGAGPDGAPQRYLLMRDGDVWREAAPPAGKEPPTWLGEPDDDIVSLLAKSLGNARLGGTGFLAAEEQNSIVAADRRTGQMTYQGHERRQADD